MVPDKEGAGFMGNFISVCTDEPEKIAAIVASKDRRQIEVVVEANPRIAREQEVRQCLARLVDGDFRPGEQPDGAQFVYAFQATCEAVAADKTTVEIYVDEDMFPEIWNFVWGAAEAPQGLPMSEFGSPAVGYWDALSVSRQILVLERLDFAALKSRADNSYREEVAGIVDVLKSAAERERGVFVFFNE
jgi:hypothetical protein